MTKEFIIESLRKELPYLKRKFGLQTIGLFGSYSKDISDKNSDLDFFVEVNEPVARNYFELWNYLEKKFDIKIDLNQEGSTFKRKIYKNCGERNHLCMNL